MEAFFKKYGGQGHDPYDAIELICNELYEIKQKVAKGQDVHKELEDVSNMIDDFGQLTHGMKLEPVRFRDVQSKYGDNHNPQNYGNYPDTRRIGYDVHYPMYPIYPPYFDRDNPGRDLGDGYGRTQRGDEYSRDRRNYPQERRGR